MSVTTPTVSDGRRMRSERSRAAILDAALALIREGVLVPTAQQIAEKAGVGMRTFFRHFEDMESLFATLDETNRAAYEARFALGERRGSLDERIRFAVQHRADAYERLKNVALSTQAQLWRSQVMAKNYARNQRKLRSALDTWLPELATLSPEEREAVDAITSFEMWHRLRSHQRLSRKTCMDIVTDLLRNLLL